MSLDKFLLDDIVYRRKHPQHRGALAQSIHTYASNTSCGDEIDLYLKIDGNKIADAKFNGQMCSIANYGAELLIDHIIGLSAKQARQTKNADLLKTEQGSSLLCNPVRLKCFELCQHALAKL